MRRLHHAPDAQSAPDEGIENLVKSAVPAGFLLFFFLFHILSFFFFLPYIRLSASSASAVFRLRQ